MLLDNEGDYKMFRNIICYAILLVCWSSLSMNQDRRDDSVVRTTVTLSYDFANDLLNEYANHGFSIWEADGKRFLDQSFLDEYVKTGIAPILDDGRPTIGLWLNYTCSSNTFFVGWNWETRSALAKPLLEHMLDIYSDLEIGTDSIPSYLDLIKAILTGIEESIPF